MMNYWKPEEEQFLRDNYMEMDDKELGKKVNRTKTSINARRFILKINRGRRFWTSDEEQFLRNNYMNMIDKELGKILNRTKTATNSKLRKLKLRKNKMWSPKENEFVRNNYLTMSSKKIAEKLNKSISSVGNKLYYSNLKRPSGLGNHLNIKYGHMKNIPKQELQILLGSILGDGYLREPNKYSCHLHELHCIKQLKYLKWKKNMLGDICPMKDVRIKKETNSHPIECEITTRMLPIRLRKMFYPKGKKVVTREILNMFEPLGLAVWICDDGCYNYHDKSMFLSTCCFNYKEHEIIQKWFKDKFDIKCKIGKTGRKYHYIKFNIDNTKKLIPLISSFVPDSMRYKLGEDMKKVQKARKQIREYGIKNKEKIAEQKRKYYQKNRKYILKRQKLYINNPENARRHKETIKKWRKKNKKIISQKGKEYYYKKKEAMKHDHV